MPSERSLYRKIQLTLDVAKSSEADSLTDLTATVVAKQFPNFDTLQYDEEVDDFTWRQSDKVVRRTVRLCNHLGLVQKDGRLSKIGRQATRKTRFEEVIAERVRIRLMEAGVEIGRLNRIIKKKLQSEPTVLPTAAELWDEVEPQIARAEFSRMLTLLTHCGAAASSQRKIFLSFQ